MAMSMLSLEKKAAPGSGFMGPVVLAAVAVLGFLGYRGSEAVQLACAGGTALVTSAFVVLHWRK